MTGDSGLIVTEYAPIDAKFANLNATNKIVNSYATYTLTVNLPMPLETGCILMIDIPLDVTFDEKLTDVQVYGIFGYQRKVQFSLSGDYRKLRIDDACLEYREESNPAVIIITQLKNPRAVMPTGSFILSITD